MDKHEARMREQEIAEAVYRLRQSMIDWMPPLRARVALALGCLLVGFGILAGAISAATWWFAGEDTTETTVYCDDDYTYGEEDGVTVEAFTDANGTPCWRETRQTWTGMTDGWPVGLSIPVNTLVFLFCAVFALVGFFGGLIMLVYPFTDHATDWWRDIWCDLKAEALAEKMNNDTDKNRPQERSDA